jgi:hypothetical protein
VVIYGEKPVAGTQSYPLGEASWSDSPNDAAARGH